MIDYNSLTPDKITYKGRKITELTHEELLDACRCLFVAYRSQMDWNEKMREIRDELDKVIKALR